jgi:hypothetical protein
MEKPRERGMALITTMLVLILVAVLVAGFSWLIMTDEKLGGVNGNEQFAFYGGEAGMEKLTADLGTLFAQDSAPSGAEVNALATAASVPQIPGIQYLNPDGTLGYSIVFPADGNGNPLAQNHTILSGPYQGMVGQLTPFTLTVTARTESGGSEVKLQRSVQTVSIPVFQFGIFSQTDLSFFAGPNFNFGGRVHTNGNLYLAEGDGNTLSMSDKVTVAGDVIRTNLSNGWLTNNNYTGTVDIAKAPGTYRAMATTEGSLTGTLGSPLNPNWPTISLGDYNGYIRNKLTGAKTLNLSIVLNGNANPIDLVRRPIAGEDVSNPSTLTQRYYADASVRILLSDNRQDITQLPCAAPGGSPINLAAAGATFGGIPVAASANAGPNYSAANGYWTAGSLVPGYIEVDVQTTYAVPPNACGVWKDVTAEVLGFGIAGPNLNPGASGTVAPPGLPALPGSQLPVSPCANPSPNAIIRFERVRDNPAQHAPCGVGSTAATDYWPNALFDTREGNFRDFCPFNNCNNKNPMLNGVVDYTELDINNLARWLTGAIGANGALAKDPVNSTNDFVVYFSDRRGNYTPAPVTGWPLPSPSGTETGEYGFEDLINPGSQYACPNGALDTGETLDQVENAANQAVGGTPEDYGETSPAAGADPAYPKYFANVPSLPSAGGAILANPNCALANLWPGKYVNNAMEARENVPLFFRRALKIVDGSSINLGACPDGVPCGLTIASENPLYVQGDFNAAANGNFGGAHVAAAVLADAVTLLSNNWNDVNSFSCPYGLGGTGVCNYRAASTTTYRLAVAAGKGISFPQPVGYTTYQDFGTDGGVHNFLRMMENWGGQTLFYRGSIVSFYYNRQATGVYKCCTTVYSPPSRGYNFDSDFLTPSLLPPRTPMFRDVNTVGFSQMILPNQ